MKKQMEEQLKAMSSPNKFGQILKKTPKIINNELKTYADIKEQGTQISKLDKERPLELRALITSQIVKAYTANPVGMAIGGEVVEFITNELIIDYKFLKAEEIPVIFKNGIKGRYGRQYNQFGAAMIFDWFKQYDTDEKHSQHAEKKAAEFKAAENNRGEVDYESHKKVLAEAREKISKKEKMGFSDPKKAAEQKKIAREIMKNNPQ